MTKRLAVLSVLMIFSSVAIAQPTPSSRRRSVGIHPQPLTGGAAIAKDLATGISVAGSDEERSRILFDVMRAFNVGVYKPSGDAVLRGAERGPRDFYLYDLEVTMMSTSLGRKDSWDVADIVAALTEMEILPDNKPIAPEQLRNILLTVTREAYQSPNDRYSLLPLLVRELGLRQEKSYDLLDNVPIEKLSFNALQRFLIIADITLPILRDVGPALTRSTFDAGGVLKWASPSDQNACESMVGTAIKEGWAVGKFGLTLIKAISTVSKFAMVIIDGIHGSMLALSIEVRAVSPYAQATHYGHSKPGKELRFSILVNMRDELPDLVIQCGWLLGVMFPKKGPIPGVKVLWEWAPVSYSNTRNLDEHGQIICEAETCKQTGPDGIATLVFKPKNERQPFGIGLSYLDEGLVTGVGLYQSKHKNTLGSLNQIVTPKYGQMFWDVSYHQDPKFALDFKSSITGTQIGLQAHSDAHVTLDLEFDESKGYTGNGSMTYDTVAHNTLECEPAISGHGTTTFDVIAGDISGDLGDGGNPKIQLAIRPGQTKEDFVADPKCPIPTGTTTFWSGLFYGAHLADFGANGGFNIAKWTYVGQTPGGVFAKSNYNSLCSGICEETTTLELRLKRQQPPPGH